MGINRSLNLAHCQVHSPFSRPLHRLIVFFCLIDWHRQCVHRSNVQIKITAVAGIEGQFIQGHLEIYLGSWMRQIYGKFWSLIWLSIARTVRATRDNGSNCNVTPPLSRNNIFALVLTITYYMFIEWSPGYYCVLTFMVEIGQTFGQKYCNIFSLYAC